MPFMMEIEATRPSPLDQLALDYFSLPSARPSLEFCRRVAGVAAEDGAIARRLGVAISTVRGWRDLGRRSASCR